MPSIRRVTSIGDMIVFTEAVGQYVDAVIRTNHIEQEKSVQYDLASASDAASYRALVAIIDGYVAEKVTETLEKIHLRLNY